MDSLIADVRSFWERDYLRDVPLLNDGLAKKGRATAGFEAAPPSILTGDPFSLTPGDCIGVIGLNPKWQPEMENSEEFELSVDEHRSPDGFSRYVERRARYFLPDSDEFYGRYFSKLQNRLAETFIPEKAADPRSVFRTSAFKLDLLPWFSTDTSLIDERRISLDIEPIRAWRGVIRSFLHALQPRVLVLNGCSMRSTAGLLLGTTLEPFEYGAKRDVAYFGCAQGVPVLAHRQLNAIGAPAGPERYTDLVASWRMCIN